MSRLVVSSVQYPKNRALSDLTWIVLGAFYAFIFFIPLQGANVGSALGIDRIASLSGYLFILTTVLKPRLCYRRPNTAFWCFGSYLVISFLIGLSTTDQLSYLITLVQLLILFWISSNLLRNNVVARRALFMIGLSCIVLAVTQALGLTSDDFLGRETILGANPNEIGTTLMLGVLALAGLAYGREESSLKARAFFWFFSALLFLSIIKTGSRGTIVALLLGLGTFALKRTSLGGRAKLASIVVVSVLFVVIASQSIESVSDRWKATFDEGDTAGRDEIYTVAWQLFLEKPIFGWGPINHAAELGSRLGLDHPRDFHNLFLHILTEVGLTGAIPFFLGILICLWAAWKGRKSTQGVVPLAMILSMLAISAKGTTMDSKLLWFVFAYAAASATYPLVAAKRQRRSSLAVTLPRREPAIARFR